MPTQLIPPFAEWERTARGSFEGDPLWTVTAFRLAMYAVACHQADRQRVARLDRLPAGGQLIRALGSISANIAEGYSRSTLPDRLRFMGFALGSAREALVWYEILRPELGTAVNDRQATVIQVRRLLVTTFRRARPAGGTEALRNRR